MMATSSPPKAAPKRRRITVEKASASAIRKALGVTPSEERAGLAAIQAVRAAARAKRAAAKAARQRKP